MSEYYCDYKSKRVNPEKDCHCLCDLNICVYLSEVKPHRLCHVMKNLKQKAEGC